MRSCGQKKNSNGLNWCGLGFCAGSLFEWAFATQKQWLQSCFHEVTDYRGIEDALGAPARLYQRSSESRTPVAKRAFLYSEQVQILSPEIGQARSPNRRRHLEFCTAYLRACLSLNNECDYQYLRFEAQTFKPRHLRFFFDLESKNATMVLAYMRLSTLRPVA